MTSGATELLGARDELCRFADSRVAELSYLADTAPPRWSMRWEATA